MKKRFAVLAVILAVITSLSACTSSKQVGTTVVDLSKNGVIVTSAADPAKSPKAALDRKDTVVVGTSDMNGVFNPLFAQSSYDMYANELMFDTLIVPDFDAKPEAWAATYSVSGDGLTYTFKLKSGIKYWDGNTPTASDVEFALYVLADPAYDGPTDITSADIKGLDDYKNGSATKISGIKVVDSKTLTVTLNAPNAAAIWNMNVPLLEKSYYGADFKKGDAATVEAIAKPMGSGQYTYDTFQPGSALNLVANSEYFQGKPKIPKVVFSITDVGQELQRVQVGETDIDMAAGSEDNMNMAKNAGFINVYGFPTNGFGYIQLNLQEDKFKDVKVRQALMYALNRKDVVKQVYSEYAKVINIPMSSVSWSYSADGLNNYDFDLDKAGKLLDDAGWKLSANGKREKDGKPLTIDFSCISGNPITDVMVPVMKDDYAKIGVDVTVENLDASTLIDKIVKNELDAYFISTGLTPDPDPSALFKTGGSQNFAGFSDPKVDDLLSKELKEINIDKRKVIFKQLWQQLNEDLPYLTIYQRSDMWVANARLKNLDLSSYRDVFVDFYKASIATVTSSSK